MGFQILKTAKVPDDEISKTSSPVKVGQFVLTSERGDVSGEGAEEGTEERILKLKYAISESQNFFSKENFDMRSLFKYFLYIFSMPYAKFESCRALAKPLTRRAKTIRLS